MSAQVANTKLWRRLLPFNTISNDHVDGFVRHRRPYSGSEQWQLQYSPNVTRLLWVRHPVARILAGWYARPSGASSYIFGLCMVFASLSLFLPPPRLPPCFCRDVAIRYARPSHLSLHRHHVTNGTPSQFRRFVEEELPSRYDSSCAAPSMLRSLDPFEQHYLPPQVAWHLILWHT